MTELFQGKDLVQRSKNCARKTRPKKSSATWLMSIMTSDNRLRVPLCRCHFVLSFFSFATLCLSSFCYIWNKRVSEEAEHPASIITLSDAFYTTELATRRAICKIRNRPIFNVLFYDVFSAVDVVSPALCDDETIRGKRLTLRNGYIGISVRCT